ncbi:hypothetical protein [Kallotenue papyrolyticum]|uniref:hypothetical protein n=1 Tax=Kallotenue papyrolyticum TaxID=1325125 RepID=UPI0004785325|nr:hypothetical protein [Kallotenue papyrolyticum]
MRWSTGSWIVDRGYSQRFGARYLRRQIEKLISYPLAQALVTRPTPPGSLVRLYVQHERRRIRAALIPPDEASTLQGTLIELDQERRTLTLAELQRELPALHERVEQAAAISMT